MVSFCPHLQNAVTDIVGNFFIEKSEENMKNDVFWFRTFKQDFYHSVWVVQVPTHTYMDIEPPSINSPPVLNIKILKNNSFILWWKTGSIINTKKVIIILEKEILQKKNC